MPNLKAIRQRIASVKSTRQVTAAMKMVAAAKLRKVQNKVIQLRPYVRKLNELIPDMVSGYYGDFESVFLEKRDFGKHLLVIISSNRGLCGAFNINVVKKLQEVYDNLLKNGEKQENIEIFAFGKKAFSLLKFKKYTVKTVETEIFDKLNDIQYIKKFSEKFIEQFLNKTYKQITLIYNSFKTTGTQILKVEQLLPFKIEQKKKMAGGYIFEPDFEHILNKLIPEAVFMKFYQTILDSFAAEQAARMTAMHKATENADEMIKQLTLSYNKARQAAITKEMLEIVTAAEALKNQ